METAHGNSHTLSLISEHEGTEEWLCPTCGRHMLVNWNPKFKRTVIEEGDPSATYNGFKNEFQPEDMIATLIDTAAPREESEQPVDEARLIPWAIWMEKSDFANLWNG